MKFLFIALISTIFYFAMVVMYLPACDDGEEDEIPAIPTEDDDTEDLCTCEEAIELLYDTCGITLIDQEGLPISKEMALLGCELCQLGNAFYDPYCCIRTCCDENDTCDGDETEDGMKTCTYACLPEPPPVPTPEPLF